MMCTSGVHHHSVQSTGLLDDLIDRSGDSRFVGHISGDSEELAGVAFGHSSEVISGLTYVNGVHLGRTVGKAALCDTQTDSAVGASN